MVTFDDLLVGKLLTEYQICDGQMLRAILREMDATDSMTGLPPTLAMRGVLLSETRLSQIHRRMEHYKFMLSEALFTDMLRQQSVVLPAQLQMARAEQKQEGFRRRLLDILVQHGSVAPHDKDALQLAFQTRLNQHIEGLIQQYRRKDFEGVTRPLSKGAGHGSGSKHQAPQPTPSTAAGPPPSSHGGTPIPHTGTPIPHTGTPVPYASTPVPHTGTPIPPPAATPVPGVLADTGGFSAMPGPRHNARTAAIKLPGGTDPSLVAQDPGGWVIAGRYRVERKLGEGNMGQVLLAHDEDDRAVAVKVIHDALRNADMVARFKREILATSFFDHENVVQIYDAGGFGDGSYYMAMEFVPGETLRDLIKREGPLEARRAFAIFRQLCNALAAAHTSNIIHRDLKPENLMVIRGEGGAERLKVMDFGLAKILDREEMFEDQIYNTMAGTVSGTPAYMAPEQISGDILGLYTDVYAMGLILFELLTAKRPYTAKTQRAFMAAHLSHRPIPLVQACPELTLPETVQELIDRMLVKKPKERMGTCEEVLAWIDEKVMPALETAA